MSRPIGLRWAGRTLIASGAIAAIGIAFLFAMFAAFAVGAGPAGRVLGRINDILVLAAYLLAAPGVLAVHAVERPRAPIASDLLACLGLVAIAAIVVLQALLIGGILTFAEQVGAVTVALLALGAWFALAGHLGATTGTLPGGVRLGLLAATYVGYPLWARWLGRRLVTMSGEQPYPHAITA